MKKLKDLVNTCKNITFRTRGNVEFSTENTESGEVCYHNAVKTDFSIGALKAIAMIAALLFAVILADLGKDSSYKRRVREREERRAKRKYSKNI